MKNEKLPHSRNIQQAKKNENEIIPILEQYFGKPITQYSNEYSLYDFKIESTGQEIEYRRRFCRSDKHSTIMLSEHKFKQEGVLFVVEWDDIIAYRELEMWWAEHSVPFNRTNNWKDGDTVDEKVVWMKVPNFITIFNKSKDVF